MNAKETQITEDEYEDMLNEIYGEVTVCGFTYEQGTLLKNIDPVAFRCGISDEPLCYECGECGIEYRDEDDAESCCRDHYFGECLQCGDEFEYKTSSAQDQDLFCSAACQEESEQDIEGKE